MTVTVTAGEAVVPVSPALIYSVHSTHTQGALLPDDGRILVTMNGGN